MPGVQTTEQRDRFGVAFVVRQRRVPPSFVYESAGPVGRAESVPRSDVRGDVGGQHVVRDTSSYRAVMRQRPARCGVAMSRCDINGWR